MFINKTEENLYADTLKTLTYLLEKNITILRIRYVKDWSFLAEEKGEEIQVLEPGYLIEYDAVENTAYRNMLLGESEMFVNDEPPEREYEHHLGKDFLCHQLWYEFPVIWGELLEDFDEERDYVKGGKYESNDYYPFSMKYE